MLFHVLLGQIVKAGYEIEHIDVDC